MRWVWLAVFLPSALALGCGCGVVSQQRVVLNLATGEPAENACFTSDNDPAPFCSKARFRRTNIPAILNSCANTRVGSRGRFCNGYFLIPDPDGITYDVWLCDMTSDRGQAVSFQECTPEQPLTQSGFVFDLVPIQVDPLDPLWSSSSRCRDSQCPEAVAPPGGGLDPYLTNRTGQSFSVCNKAQNPQNKCSSVTGTCTCQVFHDGSQAFTGAACQFEKGQGVCCANNNQQQADCCPPTTPVGQCITTSGRFMCGVLGQARSDQCISPDGLAGPSCQRQEFNQGTMQFELVSQCNNGFACPNDTALAVFNPTSTCRADPVNVNCSCQCSLCAFSCDPGTDVVKFGQCGYHPPAAPGCECFVPAAVCVPAFDNADSCSEAGPCRAGDLCGGARCSIRMNDCHTQTLCDNSQLWSFDQLHPCVCSGRGFCNNVTRVCDCLNILGNTNYDLSPALFSTATRCSAPEDCSHCNSNMNLQLPVASTCVSVQTGAFNCSCSRYWYTNGPFQNTDQLVPSTPVFQCSLGSCEGYFSIRPNITTLSQVFPWERLRIDTTVTPPRCICPNGTYNLEFEGREYCALTPFVDPVTGILCGHGVFEFMGRMTVPFLEVRSNLDPVELPVYNLVDLGGTPTCTCEGFFNDTWVQGSWYAPNGTYCVTWCDPPWVTFFLAETPPDTQQRKCLDCAKYGRSTIVHENGETQCGGTICQNNGVWNQAINRCDCVQYPFDVNWDNDTYCNISTCGNFTFNPTTFTCNCINSTIFTVRQPPPGCTPMNIPPCIDGPQTVLGCESNCDHGTPNPNDGYNSCTCESTFWKPPLCNTPECIPQQGLPNPSNTFCNCFPTWSGGNCGISTCPLDTCVQSSPGVCTRAGSMSTLRCVCESTTQGAPSSFASTNASCDPSFCDFYSLTPLGTTVGQLPLVGHFEYTAGDFDETEVFERAGTLTNAASPPSTWTCACTAGWTKRVTTVEILNPPSTGTEPMDICNRRGCLSDEDVILVEGADPATFQCRCRCPSLLRAFGPYVFPGITTTLRGCPWGNPFNGNFQAPAANLPCPGYLPNATSHVEWIPQCLPDLVGVNCTQTQCTGNQTFDGSGACSCRNFFTPPACTVCPLVLHNPFTDYTNCACIQRGDPNTVGTVIPIANNCTFVPCDPNTNVLCQSIVFPGVIGTGGSTTGTDEPLYIILLSLLGLAMLAGIIYGIVYGALWCHQQQELARQKELEKRNKKNQDTPPPPPPESMPPSVTSVMPPSVAETQPLLGSVQAPSAQRYVWHQDRPRPSAWDTAGVL